MFIQMFGHFQVRIFGFLHFFYALFTIAKKKKIWKQLEGAEAMGDLAHVSAEGRRPDGLNVLAPSRGRRRKHRKGGEMMCSPFRRGEERSLHT